MELLNLQSDLIVNPTTLACQLGIREDLVGFGQGHMLNWEEFWELVEKAYWRNRCRLKLEA